MPAGTEMLGTAIGGSMWLNLQAASSWVIRRPFRKVYGSVSLIGVAGTGVVGVSHTSKSKWSKMSVHSRCTLGRPVHGPAEGNA